MIAYVTGPKRRIRTTQSTYFPDFLTEITVNIAKILNDEDSYWDKIEAMGYVTFVRHSVCY